MRVLFFTAAAVAACMANLGQAVRLEDNTVAYYDNFAEQTATATAPAGSDVKVAPAPTAVGSAAPAETAQEKKIRQDKELVNNAVTAATKAATPPQ